MIIQQLMVNLFQVLIVVLPILIAVAYLTVGERKTMAVMQRRVGPNIVGFYGSLQAFADALKLILKEYVSPSQSNLFMFFLGPIITLIFSLLGYLVIPFGPGITLFDFDLGILYMLAVSSLSSYGILLAGWSANSKYAFLGSLRSTAQLISYELILSSAVIIVIMITGSLNLTIIVESQLAIWYIFPLMPVFLIFLISSIAETNRAPFDLAEAESELVSGFMTEHAAVIFVYFFLAEYASILLICILTSILFLGGYLFPFDLVYALDYILNILAKITNYNSYSTYFLNIHHNTLPENNDLINLNSDKDILKIQDLFQTHNLTHDINSPKFDNIIIPESNVQPIFDIGMKNYIIMQYSLKGYFYGLNLGIKTSILVFVFIWVRASFPRIRFDQLMLYCWTILLPIIIALIFIVPCILYAFDIIPANIY